MPLCDTRQCCARHPRACSSRSSSSQTTSSNYVREDTAAAARILRALASTDGDLAVTHTTGANLPFARNWWRHLQRAGVQNFALLATDDDAEDALARELPTRHVRCPRAILSPQSAASASRGPVSYRSAGWTRLMFAVPQMVRWVLKLGVNVLWLDTDVVTLANPFPTIRSQLPLAGSSASALVLASVDGRVPAEDPRECGVAYSADARWGRSASGWKLCGGLFYVQQGSAALAFLRDWERRLRAPASGAKNQPHYNEALRAHQLTLPVRVLPCDLFPNGYRYASAAWRRAQTRSPLMVHGNWLKGSAAKLERFREWGMWLSDDNQTRSLAE